MNLRFTTVMTILSLLTCSVGVRSFANETTTNKLTKIRYKVIYDAIHATKIGTQAINSTYTVRISSLLTNVTPSDITLYIDSKQGQLPVTLDIKGTIVKFPEIEGLLQENPMIVANQPGGSMKMIAEMEVTEHGKHDGQMTYVELMQSVHLAVEQLHAAASMSTNTMPEVLALGMRLDEPDGKQIVIHAKDGDIVLKPDRKGVCAIPYTEQLYKENPKITLPKTGMESVGFGVRDQGKGIR